MMFHAQKIEKLLAICTLNFPRLHDDNNNINTPQPIKNPWSAYALRTNCRTT